MSKRIAEGCRKGGDGSCDGFAGTGDGAPCWCPCHELDTTHPKAPSTTVEYKAWHDAYYANRTQPRPRRASTWKGLLP